MAYCQHAAILAIAAHGLFRHDLNIAAVQRDQSETTPGATRTLLWKSIGTLTQTDDLATFSP